MAVSVASSTSEFGSRVSGSDEQDANKMSETLIATTRAMEVDAVGLVMDVAVDIATDITADIATDITADIATDITADIAADIAAYIFL